MFPTDFFIFLQIILFMFITPGPPRVVIVSHTLNYGLSRSIWTALGDITANFFQGVVVVFFIGTLLSDNPQILSSLKWAGIIYLIYLAYDTLNSKIKLKRNKQKNLKSTFSFFKDGFLVAGLSPKSIIFFGTIFTSFINFSSNYFAQFFILIFTYVTLDFLTLMVYGLAANKVSIWLKGNPKFLNTISACVLIFIAIYVALSQNY
jgi:homoserine/homoserine lactone efflux protein